MGLFIYFYIYFSLSIVNQIKSQPETNFIKFSNVSSTTACL